MDLHVENLAGWEHNAILCAQETIETLLAQSNAE